MKDKLQQATSTAKRAANHVYDRRGRYCVAAGFIAGAVVTRKLDNDTRALALAFIESKGLSDEFFLAPEDLAEIVNN